MALKKLYKGFGQIELNNVSFRRSGRIEAQCSLDPTDFAEIPAENGMLLAVDKLKNVVKLPEEGVDFPIAINYSSEHMYDEVNKGLANFKLTIGDFLPRLGYLSVGEIFTTNCICADDAVFADVTAVKDGMAAGIYGVPCALGCICLVEEKPASGVVLRAVKATTMPDGKFALKFQVERV